MADEIDLRLVPTEKLISEFLDRFSVAFIYGKDPEGSKDKYSSLAFKGEYYAVLGLVEGGKLEMKDRIDVQKKKQALVEKISLLRASVSTEGSNAPTN